MAALPVVEDLDVFEERGLRLAPGSKARAMHEFGLESAEEALHRGVVQAVPLSAHRGCDAVCLERRAVVAAASCARRSEWWSRPLGGRRFRMAIFSASSHRVFLRRSDIDHPTISIVARSFTAAK